MLNLFQHLTIKVGSLIFMQHDISCLKINIRNIDKCFRHLDLYISLMKRIFVSINQ